MNEMNILYLIIGLCVGYVAFPISFGLFILILMRYVDKPINKAAKAAQELVDRTKSKMVN